MNTLDRYIANQVIRGSALVLLTLVSINQVLLFSTEVGDIGKGDYDLGDVLTYSVAKIPWVMYRFIPMAAIIGTLLQVGVLASNSELIAMQSTGVSRRRIVFAALKGGMYLIVLSFILSEFIIPFSEPYAQQLRTLSVKKGAVLKGAEGLWIREGDLFINIKNILPDTKLKDITILKFNKNMALEALSHAVEAHPRNTIWILKDVDITTINSGKVHIEETALAEWQGLLNTEIINTLVVEPEHQSLISLLTYIEHLRSNKLNAVPYLFAYWGRVIFPFVVLAMIALVFPLLFGNLRSTSMGLRITVGILISFSYLTLSRLSISLGTVYNFNPLLSNLAPLLILFLLGWFFTKKSISR